MTVTVENPIDLMLAVRTKLPVGNFNVNLTIPHPLLTKFFPLTCNQLHRLMYEINNGVTMLDNAHWRYRGNYHNSYHVRAGLDLLAEMLDHMEGTKTDITLNSVQALILALITHDSGHTLGAFKDHINVAIALDNVMPVYDGLSGMYFPKFIGSNFANLFTDMQITTVERSKEIINLLHGIVANTVFPYGPNLYGDVSSFNAVAIFRDIDRLCGMSAGDWWMQIYEGLWSEFKTPSFVQFCENQVTFLKDFTFYSGLMKEWFDTTERFGPIYTKCVEVLDTANELFDSTATIS